MDRLFGSRDNGCGIAEHDLQKLKDPFFTTKPPGEGTGLGLSVSHGYLDEHGGELEISSPGPGKGASFQIWLPLEKHLPDRFPAINPQPIKWIFCYFNQFSLGAGTQFVEG